MEERRIRIEQGIYKVTRGRQTEYFVKVSQRIGKDGDSRPCRQGWAPNLHQARQLRHQLWLKLKQLAEKGICPAFGEFTRDEYYSFLESQRRASTVYRQKSVIEAYLIPAFKERPLDQITTEEIEALIEEVCKGKSTQTKKHFIAYTSDIFKRALKKGLVPTNPCDRIDRPKVTRKDQLALSEDEARILLGYLRCNYELMFFHVALALHTLCRAGELRALTWGDVDFKAGQITINKTRDVKTGLKLGTKNSESRKIPINDELRQILLEIRKQTFSAPVDPVLPHWREFASGEQGKPLKIICQSLGLPLIRFHDLRSSGISLLLKKGVPLAVVMLIAGHKRISSTNIYLRLSGKDTVGATNCLQFLSAPSPGPDDNTDSQARPTLNKHESSERFERAPELQFKK